MNMFNKNNFFLYFSILLGFIISYFYNKDFDKKFIFIFLITTLILYVIFYYLVIEKQENFRNYYNSNFYGNNFYGSKFYNENNIYSINDEEEKEEEEITYQKKFRHAISSKLSGKNIFEEEEEENQKLYHNIIEEEEHKKLYHNIIEEEEHKKLYHNIIEEEEEKTIDKTISSLNIYPNLSADNQNYQIPDLNKFLFNNLPNGQGVVPLNINISYNSQNNNNELNNNKNVDNEDSKNNKNNKGKLSTEINMSKNLGEYNDNSRISNNSDWIYGNNAWTNNPDYYIPRKIPQPLNQLINSKKPKENIVCPLMINTPWTEYKSGDSEPEPYNL